VIGDTVQALRWTDQHPRSIAGRGVLLYRHSGTVLAELPAGAVIEVTTAKEARRVARALGLSEAECAQNITLRRESRAGDTQ